MNKILTQHDNDFQEVDIIQVSRSLEQEFYMFKSEFAKELSMASGVNFTLKIDEVSADISYNLSTIEEEFKSQEHIDLLTEHYQRMQSYVEQFRPDYF